MEADILLKNKAERIKDIEEFTKTEISIKGGKNDTKRKVVIRGSEHNINIARLKIEDGIHGVTFENLLLTNIEANSLVVNRAEIIKTIEMETAAKISAEARCGILDRRVRILGSEKAVKSAKLKIEEAISKMKHSTLLLKGVEVGVSCLGT